MAGCKKRNKFLLILFIIVFFFVAAWILKQWYFLHIPGCGGVVQCYEETEIEKSLDKQPAI